MTRIETMDADDMGAEARLHVMPGGNMMCAIAGVALWPTPGWLCRGMAMLAVQKHLQGRSPVGNSYLAHASDDQLFRAGLRFLHEAAPLVLDIPYNVLHSQEERSS